MRVLWFLPKWPHPAFDGATRAHMALLNNWPNQKHELDIVVFGEDKKKLKEIEELRALVGFRDLLQLPLLNNSKAFFVLTSFFEKKNIPTTVKRFTSPKAKDQFAKWSKDKEWTHLIFDGLHSSGIFWRNNQWVFPSAEYICVRAHNFETELWTQIRKRANIAMKWIYAREEKKMAHFEKSLYETSHFIATVSEIDVNKIKTLLPKVSVHSIPIGIEWNAVPTKIRSEKINLLFIGRLDWYPNAQGLIWFLDKIWPQVQTKRNDIFLDVIGDFATPSLRKKMERLKNINYHGKVPTIDTFYEKATLAIIPIWIGSGTRVKAIEAAKFSRSFITTTKGIEGVNLSSQLDFIEANDDTKWIETLKNISTSECEALGFSIYTNAKVQFDQKIIQEKFIKKLESLETR